MRTVKLIFSIVFGFALVFILISGLAHARNTFADVSSTTATLTVCSDGCDYLGIQEAINAANAGDTISLLSEIYTETITISKSITLLGNGAQNSILQAASSKLNAASRVITITSGVSVSVQGLTIRNGSVENENGGGIYSTGVLTLSESIISQNEVLFGSGGGIYSLGGLYIYDTVIENNIASMGSGGGVYNRSNHAIFDHVTFDKKRSSAFG